MLKYKQEITKNNVDFLNQTIPIHLSTDPPFDGRSLVQAPMINSIYKPSLQQELYRDYKIITQHNREHRLNNYMKILEDQICHYDKSFNRIIDKIYRINSSVEPDQQLTSIMLKIIDQRLNNITTFIRTIYKFKRQLVALKSKNRF